MSIFCVWTYLDLSGVEHHDLRAIQDGIEAMCNSEHRAVGKLLSDGGLAINVKCETI